MAEAKSSKNLSLIAFDFGTKKIGVAIGQTITQSATPLAPLKAYQGEPNWQVVKQLIAKWQPQAVVVGIPYNMDGTQQPITQKAKIFALKIKEHCQLPVYEVDERLTTIEARERLFELGGHRALKEISIDSFAAKIILESWMHNNE